MGIRNSNMTTSLADYNHLKRRYFQALNLRGAPPTRKIPISKSAPMTIASPVSSPSRFEDEMVFSSSVGYTSSPIPVPTNEEDSESGLDSDFGYSKSAATFVPPHLLSRCNEDECSFSMYEYQKKRQICKNAF